MLRHILVQANVAAVVVGFVAACGTAPTQKITLENLPQEGQTSDYRDGRPTTYSTAGPTTAAVAPVKTTFSEGDEVWLSVVVENAGPEKCDIMPETVQAHYSWDDVDLKFRSITFEEYAQDLREKAAADSSELALQGATGTVEALSSITSALGGGYVAPPMMSSMDLQSEFDSRSSEAEARIAEVEEGYLRRTTLYPGDAAGGLIFIHLMGLSNALLEYTVWCMTSETRGFPHRFKYRTRVTQG